MIMDTGRSIDHEVLIVGAGFGGMGVAIQLQRMGIDDVLIVDRASDLGGTWHLNKYPGLAVDIASTTYSYSFEPNPYWSRLYAPGAELKAYALHVAHKYKLRRWMRFNCNVKKAVYDCDKYSWTVYISGQVPVTARILVLATGFLSQPKWPDIAGLKSFAGKVIHTAEWDDNYDLNGKRAAIIGTGATAVQLLPRIAKKLAHLDVYQRTPIWVLPKFDPKIPMLVRQLFAYAPLTQKMARYTTSSILEIAMVAGALYYKQLPMLARGSEEICKAHLARQIPNKELRQKLTPNYSFGCKRPTFANDYYPTFLRNNVELVTEGIDHIDSDGIIDRTGKKRPMDTLILATGYKVWEKGNFPAFDVCGKDGVELGERWRQEGYQSYEGITVHGYPNMFYLAAPYSYTGLSYFYTIEAHMRHIGRCLGQMRRCGAQVFEVKSKAQQAYVQQMQQRLANSVFVHGHCAPANSYYFNQHGEFTIGRPTPTPLTLWQAGHYPLNDYQFS